jgi:hypothetical protein
MIRGSWPLPSESWRPGAEHCFVAGGTVGTTWDPSYHVPMPGTSTLPVPNSYSGCFPVPGTRFPVHMSLWSRRLWVSSSVAWSLCPERAPLQRGTDTGTQERGRVASVSYFGGSDMMFIVIFLIISLEMSMEIVKLMQEHFSFSQSLNYYSSTIETFDVIKTVLMTASLNKP